VPACAEQSMDAYDRRSHRASGDDLDHPRVRPSRSDV
jgi:hypothetical protein